MRGKDANGRPFIYAPKDKQAAAHKLAELSALAASREWERAALVALMVQPAKRGRPAKTAPEDSFTIDGFMRLGIYGLRSRHAVLAYLNAWALSGFPRPCYGDKVTLPSGEFPDFADIYPDRHDGSGAKEREDETTEMAEDDAGSENPGSKAATSRRSPPPRRDPIDNFLDRFTAVDPSDLVKDEPVSQIKLLIKTVRSWVESLEESLHDLEAEDG